MVARFGKELIAQIFPEFAQRIEENKNRSIANDLHEVDLKTNSEQRKKEQKENLLTEESFEATFGGEKVSNLEAFTRDQDILDNWERYRSEGFKRGILNDSNVDKAFEDLNRLNQIERKIQSGQPLTENEAQDRKRISSEEVIIQLRNLEKSDKPKINLPRSVEASPSSDQEDKLAGKFNPASEGSKVQATPAPVAVVQSAQRDQPMHLQALD